MNKGKYVFSQVIDFVPKYQFDQLVKQYNGNYRVRVFTCWEQFLCLTFGHLTFRNSLRDIVLCLAGEQIRRYHLGFRSKIARATFSDANQNRDWRIYRDFAAKLMDQARQLYHDSPKELEAPIPIYALDSTLIRMCVGIFTWANYRKTTAGVKMHTLLDVNTAIPHFVCLTDGKVSDNKVLELLRFEVDALYVMDRGYFDLKQLNRIHLTLAFFVLRVKRTINFRRQYSQSTAEHDHIKFD